MASHPYFDCGRNNAEILDGLRRFVALHSGQSSQLLLDATDRNTQNTSRLALSRGKTHRVIRGAFPSAGLRVLIQPTETQEK